ncbi:MAG: hypothetical protein GWP32_00815 [Bacteroidetes bacterium]|nr:hypothetical protein [Bacteroidota bacterium]
MSKHTENLNFRYSNDNRRQNPSSTDYPSQDQVITNSTKGDRSYYPNDNGGHYPNSNRPDISTIDPANKKQPPNSNYKIP